MPDDHLPLFVYGTLRDGGPAANLLAGLRRTPARARGVLWRLPAGYPALTPSAQAWVDGELVEPPGTTRLRLVDRYEGIDEGLYRRARMVVECGGKPVHAWVYLMDDPAARGGVPARGKLR